MAKMKISFAIGKRDYSLSPKDLKTMIKLLKELEWSGTTESEGAYMGGPPLSYHASCPICGGLKDDEHARLNFIPEAFGHKEDCSLGAILELISQ